MQCVCLAQKKEPISLHVLALRRIFGFHASKLLLYPMRSIVEKFINGVLRSTQRDTHNNLFGGLDANVDMLNILCNNLHFHLTYHDGKFVFTTLLHHIKELFGMSGMEADAAVRGSLT